MIVVLCCGISVALIEIFTYRTSFWPEKNVHFGKGFIYGSVCKFGVCGCHSGLMSVHGNSVLMEG